METKTTLFSHFNLSGTNLLVLLVFLLLLSSLIFSQISAILPLGISALISGLLGYVVIPLLQRLKTGQVIQEDGPVTHLKKAGTPTMGGVFFVPVAIIVALVWSGFSQNAIALSLLTLAYAGIGWFDDWQILRQKSNKGISPRLKLTLQIIFAILFCLWMFWSQPNTITTISLPGNLVFSLGWLFWILAGFVLVAESNATNLTDGVDGLAAGTGAIAFLALGIIITPTAPDLMLFCFCFSGACLGFLLHNRNPATVFMGDTGSLAIGGALAGVALLTDTLWQLFLLSGIFFVESLSVIAQVTYFKATKGPDGKGKRLFKMAPLHHHLELSGWSETQVVASFYLISWLLAQVTGIMSLIKM